MLHALDSNGDAAAEYARRLNEDETRGVLELFAARIEKKIPAAYLMGRMWFAGLEFEVDPRVIVPRSPFAELIDAAFEPCSIQGVCGESSTSARGPAVLRSLAPCVFPMRASMP